MSAYYNENDPFAAAWLRELIKAKLIAEGEVDDRSIEAVEPADLVGFRQCHFFAGIGGWSYALRLAGWPDEREVWTGSCPCQPWSVAGKSQGADDPRDLWPAWRKLISERHPSVVFGEQVTGADGLFWLDRVYVGMEAQAYAVGAADLPAAGVGAPMVSQRLFFVAASESERTGKLPVRQRLSQQTEADINGHGEDVGLAEANGDESFWWSGPLQVGWNAIKAEVERGGRCYRAQWRLKPGLSLLADGIPRRVERLCGFGNAIVPQVAQIFIEAYMQVCEERT